MTHFHDLRTSFASGFYFLSQERKAQKSGATLEERLQQAEQQALLSERRND